MNIHVKTDTISLKLKFLMWFNDLDYLNQDVAFFFLYEHMVVYGTMVSVFAFYLYFLTKTPAGWVKMLRMNKSNGIYEWKDIRDLCFILRKNVFAKSSFSSDFI